MFSVDQLINLIRSQAIATLSTFSQTRVGIIVGYDPDTYTANVEIKPEGIKTGNIPILSQWIGNQWGFYSAPELNDMVIVHFQEGDFSCGFIGQRIYSFTDRPISPGPPSGETWMIHKTGTYIKFLNDGTIEMKCLDENGDKTDVNIIANVVVDGDIRASGNILDNNGTNSHDMADMRTIYNSHVHPGVTAGPSNTQVTTQTQ